MNARRHAMHISLAAGLLLAPLFGCGGGLPGRMRYAAPPQAMLQGGVSVTFQLAHSEDEVFKFRCLVTNLSNQQMLVNRDGWALRLADGRVLQRRGDRHMPYVLNPGQMHKVYVDFKERGLDMRTIQQASVIIGGISYATDPMPRVVGEIPVTLAGEAD
ncbi:MAG: hypothetical protein EXR72_09895 [Myxococcales bacterium]|nr:hypothetical protein [Myxococcales bacterium]